MDQISLLRRLEEEELSHIPSSALSSCGAFSSPIAVSLKKLISFIKYYEPSTFYDLGSGSGIVVAAIASHGVEAYGIELNPLLHKVAQKICEKFCSGKDSFHLQCKDVEKMDMKPKAYTTFYAFDVRYPDSLVKKIFEMLLDTPQKGYLITTKNQQGLGAALSGCTEELRDATEDLKACVQDPNTSKSEIKEAREILQAIRETSLEAFDAATQSKVELIKSVDFYFGSGEEDLNPTDTYQDENLTEDITEKYCEELLKKENETMSGSVERTKIYIFSKIDCSGCREGQANQKAHEDYGGCLYNEENEYFIL